MSKPNYAYLLGQIAIETNPDTKAELEAECFSFPEALTDAEKELFGYVNDGYFDFNPGLDGTTFKSYEGVYYSDTVDTT